MPQFLTTSGTSHLIEDIIIRAKTELVLITPYLKLSRILLERLTEANNRGVSIKLVYGKVNLHPGEKKHIEALTNLELLFLENLHAKCYHNGTTLIVSSMNLYDFSEKNNREMGIVLTRRDDEDCFADALAEAHSIIAAARRAVPQVKRLVIEKQAVSPPATPIPFDHKLKVRKMYELLSHKAMTSTAFKLESRIYPGVEVLMLTAQGFPKTGIDFGYDESSIRLDFRDHRAYTWTKMQKQSSFDKALQGYRCYWNQDVIQIYAASNYEYTSEQTTAEYFVHAIERAASVLQSQ
jgi:hypothetical protein